MKYLTSYEVYGARQLRSHPLATSQSLASLQTMAESADGEGWSDFPRKPLYCSCEVHCPSLERSVAPSLLMTKVITLIYILFHPGDVFGLCNLNMRYVRRVIIK